MQKTRFYPITKRAIDVFLAVLFLPVTVLVGIVLTLLNPLFNPGPLFFAQERIGQGERIFRILKFRSMVGTPKGARFATQEIGRIRPFGALLRNSHLDELPQIFNVLLGHMSFVGPRPEQPQFHDRFAKTLPCYRCRTLLRPGITGTGQLLHGYADTPVKIRARARCDLIYLRERGIKPDIMILLITAQVILLPHHRRQIWARQRWVYG